MDVETVIIGCWTNRCARKNSNHIDSISLGSNRVHVSHAYDDNIEYYTAATGGRSTDRPNNRQLNNGFPVINLLCGKTYGHRIKTAKKTRCYCFFIFIFACVYMCDISTKTVTYVWDPAIRLCICVCDAGAITLNEWPEWQLVCIVESNRIQKNKKKGFNNKWHLVSMIIIYRSNRS